MDNERINENNVAYSETSESITPAPGIDINAFSGVPAENKKSKSRIVILIAAIIFSVLDVLLIVWLAYGVFISETTKMLLVDSKITSGMWVSYESNGAYILRFNGNTCDVERIEPGSNEAVKLLSGLRFNRHGSYITVFSEDSTENELRYDERYNCLWGYSEKDGVSVQTKYLYFKDYPTTEQNERNMRGCNYLKYSGNTYYIDDIMDDTDDGIAHSAENVGEEIPDSSQEENRSFTKEEIYDYVDGVHTDLEWLYYRLDRDGHINKNDFYYENPENDYGEMYASDFESIEELRKYLSGIYDSDFINGYFLSIDNSGKHGGCWEEKDGKLYFGYNWGMGWYSFNKDYFFVEDNGSGVYTVKGIAVPMDIDDSNYDEIARDYLETITVEVRNGKLITTAYSYNWG